MKKSQTQMTNHHPNKFNTHIVNIISGPSSGKSLIAALLFAELKIAGKCTELVQEYAKKLVWLEDWETLNNQHHVSTKQFRLMKSICGSVEYIVTDGSLFHGIHYNRSNTENISDVAKTENKILEYFHSMNNINIFLKRGNFEYEQAGRTQTFEEAKEIDDSLLNLLNLHGIEYKVFESNRESIQSIVEYVFSKTIQN